MIQTFLLVLNKLRICRTLKTPDDSPLKRPKRKTFATFIQQEIPIYRCKGSCKNFTFSDIHWCVVWQHVRELCDVITFDQSESHKWHSFFWQNLQNNFPAGKENPSYNWRDGIWFCHTVQLYVIFTTVNKKSGVSICRIFANLCESTFEKCEC